MKGDADSRGGGDRAKADRGVIIGVAAGMGGGFDGLTAPANGLTDLLYIYFLAKCLDSRSLAYVPSYIKGQSHKRKLPFLKLCLMCRN